MIREPKRFHIVRLMRFAARVSTSEILFNPTIRGWIADVGGMSRRKLFKPIMLTVMLCVSMWQMPQFIGAIDAARNPKQMSEFLSGFNPPQDGAPALPADQAAPRAREGMVIYSPDTANMTDEQRRELEARARRFMPKSDTTPPKRAHSGKQRKSAEDTISDALDELRSAQPN
jgi:hypothetical protein